MTTKKKIILTVLLGVLVAIGVYCVVLNVVNIFYLKNLTQNLGEANEYKEAVEIWAQALYKNNSYLKSIIMLVFSVINIVLYGLGLFKLWKTK